MKKVIYSLLVFFMVQLAAAGQSSQTELLKDFANTSLNAFKVTEPKNGEFKFEHANKLWDVRLERSGEDVTKLILVRAGVIEEVYQPDLKEYPAYFKDISHRVVFLNKQFLYLDWKGGKATIKYVLSADKDVAGNYKEIVQDVENYINATVAAQASDRSKLAEKRAVQEAAEQKANSLNGKNVKSIAVKWVGTQTEVGHMSKLYYGIEAILADGTKLSTKNLGGKTSWDDFKITVTGAEFGEEALTVEKDAAKIPGDVIVVKVQSKYQPNITTTEKLPVIYNAPVWLNYDGQAGGVVHLTVSPGYRGGNGANLNIVVKGGTTAQGEKVNKVEVKDAGTGKVIHRVKLAPNTPLTVNVNGGRGSFGRKDTNGGNGGNGGNVTITKDPSATGFSCTVNNMGGNGGKHETSALRDGRGGSRGSSSERSGAVSLSW